MCRRRQSGRRWPALLSIGLQDLVRASNDAVGSVIAKQGSR